MNGGIERALSRIIYFSVALLVMALLAGVGAVVFFVLLGVVALVALFNSLRSRGDGGWSRDSAFSFRREDYEVHKEPRGTVIETEYHEISQTSENTKD